MGACGGSNGIDGGETRSLRASTRHLGHAMGQRGEGAHVCYLVGSMCVALAPDLRSQVHCRSLSSIHIPYNQALVGGLSDRFDPATRIANLLLCTEVVYYFLNWSASPAVTATSPPRRIRSQSEGRRSLYRSTHAAELPAIATRYNAVLVQGSRSRGRASSDEARHRCYDWGDNARTPDCWTSFRLQTPP